MASREMEALKRIMAMLGQGHTAAFGADLNLEHIRSAFARTRAQMPVERGVTFLPDTFGGVETECAVPEGERGDAAVLYSHGGGLICGDAKTSRGYASLLAAETGYPVYSYSYRLAPENPYPAALDDAMAVYREVAARHPGKSLFLLGESSGGSLSLGMGLKARDQGLVMPRGIIVYSPILDLTGALDRRFPGNSDPAVSPEGLARLAELTCKKEERKDPYVSPYYADFAGLCPIFVAWDESETLSVDASLVEKKARKAGVPVTAEHFPDCFHAFPISGRSTEEGRKVLRDTVAFMRAHG